MHFDGDRDGRAAAVHVARGERAHLGVERVERRGHVHDEARALRAEHHERRAVGIGGALGPAHADPAAGGLRIVAAGEIVFAVRAVDGHARAARDEADDAVAGHRRAAAGEFDEAVVQPLDEDAVHGVARTLVAALGRLVDAVDGVFLVGLLVAQDLVADAVDGARGGHAAVADGGVQIVERGEGQPLEDQRQDLVAHDVGRGDAVGAQLALKLLLAVDDVLLAALFFEPLLDLRARGAALGEVQPVAARAGRVFRRADVDNVAVLQHVVEVHDAAVDRRTDHAVADRGVDAVGKVDRRRAGGQIDDIALR